MHRCEFLDGARNAVLIGGPGPGKTHIATALGIQAMEHHRQKVRVFSTIERVNALEQEKAKGKAGQIAEGLTRRCARHCPRTNGGQWLALETGNDSFRFKARSAAAIRKKKEVSHALTPT